MRLITRVQKASDAAQSWKRQYLSYDGQWKYDDGKRVKYEALLALGDNPEPDDVDRVIGNNSWTRCRCDECGQPSDAVLELGEKLEYESATANVCRACLRKAAFYLDF